MVGENPFLRTYKRILRVPYLSSLSGTSSLLTDASGLSSPAIERWDLVMLEALKDSVLHSPSHDQWGWPIYLQEWLVLGVNVPKYNIILSIWVGEFETNKILTCSTRCFLDFFSKAFMRDLNFRLPGFHRMKQLGEGEMNTAQLYCN